MTRISLFFAILFFSGLSAALELKITDGDRQWSYNQQALLAMAQESMTTTTPWTEGETTYQGVYLATLLANLKIEATSMEAKALNDYTIEIPLKTATQARAFIAVAREGELMPVRDKGPFWIIFPYSEGVEKEYSDALNWSIWQMVEIKVNP